MNIGVDLDEVLANTIQALIEWHNNIYATNLTYDDFHSYQWWEVWGGTKEEAIEKAHHFFESSYFRNIKPHKNAFKIIEQLSKKHTLYIITSRQNIIENDTLEWLNRHFPDCFDEVCFGNHYGKTGEKISKKELCEKNNIDILIEDSLEYANECSLIVKKIFLFNHPWNQNTTLSTNSIRVNNWQELGEFLL